MNAISIIGAAGFVGSRLVESMVLDGRTDALAIVRAHRSLAALSRFGPAIEARLADAEDPAALAAALRGSRVVVNLSTGAPAGIVRSTRSIFEACAAAGVRRLIHTSSAVVFGDVASPGLGDDSPPVERHWMPYALAKADSERWLRAHAARAPFEITVLRPGIVWGPRSPHTMHVVGDLVARRAYLVDEGRGVFNGIAVDNFVRCIRACCDEPGDAGGFYNVADREPVTWRDFYAALAEPLGYEMARMPSVPGDRFPWSLRAVPAYVQGLPGVNGLYHRLKPRVPDALKSRLKKRLSGRYEYRREVPDYAARPAVDREVWHLQRARHRLPTDKFAARFGPELPLTFEDGIRRTLLWLDAQGLIRTPLPAGSNP